MMSATTAIFANPGQTVVLALQVTDDNGVLMDGYQGPFVDLVRLPDGTNSSSYPVQMVEITNGVWIHSLTLPTGTAATGTYVVSCSWPNPTTNHMQNQLFLIHVALPFGNSSVSPA